MQLSRNGPQVPEDDTPKRESPVSEERGPNDSFGRIAPASE